MRGKARWVLEALLCLLALAFAAASRLIVSDQIVGAVLNFGAWCAALGLIFSLGLRLPLHIRGRLARPAAAAILVAALGLVLLANIALYRHDAHFDLTVSGRFTAPPEFVTVAQSLQRDVRLTYFYNSSDEYAGAARKVLAIAAREYPHLTVRPLDLDTEIAAARDYGVRLYNTVIVEADGRRTRVENTVDLRQMAYAIERALKERMETVCFVTGHGERYAPGHVHLSHVENRSEEPGGTGVLEAPLDGIDRLKLAIETIGYRDRAIEAPTLTAVPQDCALVADLGPRTAYAPVEVDLLKNYLARGGRVLLAYDPAFPVAPELASLLAKLGLAVGDGVVVDPTNHYGTDPEQVAVPYYPPHPITAQLALTVFPGAREIRLLRPVAGVAATALIATSKDSQVRPLNATVPAAGPAETSPGPRVLAAALRGAWPDAGGTAFRLVLVGSAGFAANAFFPYASNGELAVAMIRWLADDTATPLLKPAAYSLPEVRLTHRQMQVTFVVLVVLLPLVVMLLGAAVWWRRR
jgi:hypothetical protein